MPKGRVALAVLLLLAASAFSQKEEILDQARKLVAEAQPFVAQANDIELELDARKAPRKNAYDRLKSARGLFDQYLDANPSMEDKLDKEYVELNVLIYGLRKDSAVGELDKEKEAPPALPAPKDAPAAPPPAAGTGPPAVSPELAKSQLAALKDFDQKHSGDLALLQQMYERYLRDFPDAALPEYAQAAARLGEINERIRTVFRTVTKRDVDSLARAEDDEKKAVPVRLSQDFNENDVEVRRRAARLIASTRSGAATYLLAKGLRDRDPEVEKICKEGLVAIGGTRAGANLCGFYLKSSSENRREALEVMYAIFRKTEGDAATIGPWIARFAFLRDGPVVLEALKFLKAGGLNGGPGLTFALGVDNLEEKEWICKALVEIKYVRCVARLGGWLDGGKYLGPAGALARDTIQRFGMPAVPYLFPHLTGSTLRFTNELLHTMLPKAPSDVDTQKEWTTWWENNPPAAPAGR